MNPQVWDQLKNKPRTISFKLWKKTGQPGSILEVGAAPGSTGSGPDSIAIHYHPHRTYGHKMLSDLMETTGWTEPDLKRLKLIK